MDSVVVGKRRRSSTLAVKMHSRTASLVEMGKTPSQKSSQIGHFIQITKLWQTAIYQESLGLFQLSVDSGLDKIWDTNGQVTFEPKSSELQAYAQVEGVCQNFWPSATICKCGKPAILKYYACILLARLRALWLVKCPCLFYHKFCSSAWYWSIMIMTIGAQEHC